MKLFRWRVSWISVIACLAAGCGQRAANPVQESGTPAPTYGELVQTLNAELQALDRLEEKRKQVVFDFKKEELDSKSADGKLSLNEAIEFMRNGAGAESEISSDPNELLDGIAQRSEEAEKLAQKALDQLFAGSAPAEPTPEEAAAAEKRNSDHIAKLAKLDEEIAAQQERVERARSARDAAETDKSGTKE